MKSQWTTKLTTIPLSAYCISYTGLQEYPQAQVDNPLQVTIMHKQWKILRSLSAYNAYLWTGELSNEAGIKPPTPDVQATNH